MRIFNILKATLRALSEDKLNSRIYKKYEGYTMISSEVYIKNLKLIASYAKVQGAVVECGVWRGGMIAGMADLLGNRRNYFLFDSFEGLPEAKEIDGKAAVDWQSDKQSPYYFDNCRAEIEFAEQAMKKSNVSNYQIIPGWFHDTLNGFVLNEKIAILRLDGDWYYSTMQCLEYLYPQVAEGGLIIIDDYYVWEGCSKAVHDYLSKNNVSSRIMQFQDKVAYLIKQH